jgi:hypothetical protein
MRIINLIAVVVALTACAGPYRDPKAYWARPGATLPELADEAHACYRSALDPDMPSAFPGTGPTNPLLPRTQPPPKLWERAPHDATLERFDEQLRYERCMRVRGWQPARMTTPTL